MNILVINAGSSSLKYQLIDTAGQSVLAKGLCERIGIEKSLLKHTVGEKSIEIQKDMKDHSDAIRMVLDALTDAEHGALKSLDEINAVGHRVVHGGESFAQSTIQDACGTWKSKAAFGAVDCYGCGRRSGFCCF